MTRQRLATFLRLGISIALLVVLFMIIDRQALIETFLSVNPALYLLGLVAFTGTIVTWTLRWYLFMHAIKEKISFLKALSTMTIGIFFSMFLPTIVGTDLGRVYELARDDNRRKSSLITTVLLDRLLGLLTISSMAVFGLLIGSQFASEKGIVFTVVGTLVILVVSWVVAFNPRSEKFIFGLINRLPVVKRFSESLHRVYDALYQLYRQPGLMLRAGAVSIINSLCTILCTILAARSLGVEISPIYFFIFMPIIWIIMTIPLSLSGLGVREGAFVFFFSQVGVAPSDAIAISLLYYSYNIIVGVVGGLLLLSSSLAQAQAQKKLEVS
jgi:hypothetical protein